jgi:hypothetical protein
MLGTALAFCGKKTAVWTLRKIDGRVTEFFNFLKMSPEIFDELLNRVGPRIRRVDLWVACFNEKISTEVRIFGGILFRRNGRNVNVTGTYSDRSSNCMVVLRK